MVESLSNEINLNQHHVKRNSMSQNTNTNSNNTQAPNQQVNRYLNEFERLTYELTVNSNDTLKDGSLRRIGFYSIGNELGSGNFSQVKLGIHLLTKGKKIVFSIIGLFLESCK